MKNCLIVQVLLSNRWWNSLIFFSQKKKMLSFLNFVEAFYIQCKNVAISTLLHNNFSREIKFITKQNQYKIFSFFAFFSWNLNNYVKSNRLVWSNFLFKIQMLFNSVEKRKLSLFLSCIGFPISFTRSNKVFDAFPLPRFDISSVEFTWFSIFFLWFTLNLLGIGRKENFQIYIANNFFKVSSFVAAKMTTTEEDLGTDLVKRYSFNNYIYSRIKGF